MQGVSSTPFLLLAIAVAFAQEPQRVSETVVNERTGLGKLHFHT